MRSTCIELLEARNQFAGEGVADSVSAEAAVLQYGISITWIRQSTTPVDGYRIFRSTHGHEYAQIAEVSGDFFIDSAVRQGMTYAYRVRPFTHAHGSTATLGRSACKFSYDPLDSSLFSVDVSENQKAQIYGSLSYGLPDEFRVQWAPVGEAFSSDRMKTFASYPPGGDLVEGGFGATQITGLDQKRYNFVFFVVGSDFPVRPTDIETVTMLPKPQALQATRSNSQGVRLSWISDAAAATGSRIKWRELGSDVVKSKRVPAGRLHTLIDDLRAGVAYRFDVSTLRGDSESDRASVLVSM